MYDTLQNKHRHTQRNLVQLDTLSIFWANGSRDWWLSGQASAPPPAVSEERPQPPRSQPNLQQPQAREAICVCIYACVCVGLFVHCIKKPPAPHDWQPSPNHNKPETNSTWNCNTLGDESYMDHVTLAM